jgi:hypothetical protein
MEAKGRAFGSALEYLECKFGQKKVQAFFKCHPEFDCVKKYNDLSWYSLESYLKFSEKVDKYFGFGDASLLFKIGEFSARIAFDSSHKLFRDLSIESAISNAQSVFLSYFSAGVAEVKYIKDNKVSLHIKNLPVSPYLGKSIFGWMQEAVRSVRSRDAFVAEQEDKHCLCYTLEWSKFAG